MLLRRAARGHSRPVEATFVGAAERARGPGWLLGAAASAAAAPSTTRGGNSAAATQRGRCRSSGGGPVPTTLSCTCGKCSVTFAASANRLTMECGCVDCYQANEWAAAQGGPPVPQIPRLSYWENDIISTEGEQHMGLFVLRDSAGSAAFQSVRCVAMCCYSTMLVDHPNYRGNVCMVFEHAVKLSVAPVPIDARIYMCDYDEEERGQLPSVPPGCPVTEQGPVKAGLATGRFATLPFLAPVSEPQVGSDTMQALFERLGEPIVLDLEEGEPVPYRPHRFPGNNEKPGSWLDGVRFCRPEP